MHTTYFVPWMALIGHVYITNKIKILSFGNGARLFGHTQRHYK